MAIRFDYADTDYLTTAGNYAPLNDGTFSFWIRMTSFPTLTYILGSETDFRIRLTATGEIQLRLFRNVATRLDAGVNLTLGQWYHIAATWVVAGGNSTLQLFIDGALQASDTQSDAAVSANPLIIGSANFIGSSMDGRLDDLRLYNRAIDLEQAQTIHACRGVDEIREGLLSRWMMDEGAEGVTAAGAGSVRDTVGGLNLTPVNSPVYQGSPLKTRRAA